MSGAVTSENLVLANQLGAVLGVVEVAELQVGAQQEVLPGQLEVARVEVRQQQVAVQQEQEVLLAPAVAVKEVQQVQEVLLALAVEALVHLRAQRMDVEATIRNGGASATISVSNTETAARTTSLSAVQLPAAAHQAAAEQLAVEQPVVVQLEALQVPAVQMAGQMVEVDVEVQLRVVMALVTVRGHGAFLAMSAVCTSEHLALANPLGGALGGDSNADRMRYPISV